MMAMRAQYQPTDWEASALVVVVVVLGGGGHGGGGLAMQAGYWLMDREAGGSFLLGQFFKM